MSQRMSINKDVSNIKPKTDSVSRTTEKSKNGEYIMISHDRADWSTVSKIKESLQKLNFKIWINVEHVGEADDYLEQVARAIDNATAVLICYSSSYKINKNCRTEAEYSFQKGKVLIPVRVEANYIPDRWLGMLVASRLCYYFDRKEKYEENIKSLVRELHRANSRTSINLPADITTLSDEKVQLYLESMRSGVGTFRHIRVVLIGYEGVGKTTICKRIIGNRKELDKVKSTDGANLYIQRFWVDLDTKAWKQLDEDLADQVTSRLSDVVASYQSQSDKTCNAEGDDEETGVDLKEIGAQDPDLSKSDNTDDESQPVTAMSQGVPSQEEVTIDHVLAEAVIGKDEPTNTVYSSLWDFAGQKDYYCTHHCFLSADAVYLVVFNASHCKNKEECGRVLYWLRSLKTYSVPTKTKEYSPPVIIVGTHADKIKGKKPEDVFYTFLDMLTDRPELEKIEIFRSILLDSRSESEEKFNELRNMIIAAAPHQDQWEKQLPAKWLALEREIMKKKAANTKMMTMKEIKELNSKLQPPVKTEEELKMFLGYLHACRTLLYFGESGILESKIIIDPQWLVDAFRCLIKSESFVDKSDTKQYKAWREFRTTAKLTKHLCNLAWNNSEFQLYSEELIAFMERFGLIASPKTDGQDKVDLFFVPSLLEEPDFQCLEPFRNKGNVVMSKTLCFVIDHDFVPIEIYDRVMAGCIANLSMVQGSGKRTENCIKRGFGFFQLDAVWNLIVLCQWSVISLTLLNESKMSCDDSVIGTKTRHLIEGILKSTLERNRQGQLSFDYAFHCGYKLDVDDQPIFLNDAMEYIDDFPVRCCRDKKKAEHFLNNGDIQFWGFNTAVSKPYKSKRTKDDRLDSWMMGRISRHIPTDDGFMFFTNLGLNPDKDILAKQVEFDRCSIFNQFAHMLNVWKNRHGKSSAQEILDKMEECSISTADLQQELFEENDTNEKLDFDLPRDILNRQLNNYYIKRCLPHMTSREYQLVFMELELPMETIAFQSSLTIEEHIKSLLREWRSTAGQRATVGLLLAAMRRNNLDWYCCVQSLIE